MNKRDRMYVPSKRVKNAHRKSELNIPLKEFASRNTDSKAVRAWARNKRWHPWVALAIGVCALVLGLITGCAAPAAPAVATGVGAGSGAVGLTVAVDVGATAIAAPLAVGIGELARRELAESGVDVPASDTDDDSAADTPSCDDHLGRCMDELKHVPLSLKGQGMDGSLVCDVCYNACKRSGIWPEIPEICQYWEWEAAFTGYE